jgi:hypothetical protein
MIVFELHEHIFQLLKNILENKFYVNINLNFFRESNFFICKKNHVSDAAHLEKFQASGYSTLKASNRSCRLS